LPKQKLLLGTTKKSISPLDQLKAFCLSVHRNWKDSFDYRITVCHTIPYTNKERKIIEDLDVDILKVAPSHSSLCPHICRSSMFQVELRHTGTHRFIMDIDMLVLDKFPPIDWEIDFHAAFGNTFFPQMPFMIAAICERLSIPIPDKSTFKNLMEKYYRGEDWKDFFPYFNGGMIIVKEVISSSLGDMFQNAMGLLDINMWPKHQKPHLHYLGQLVVGLVGTHLAKSWTPLPKGVNFCALIEKDFPKQKQYVYHYAGSKEYFVKKRFPDYFLF